MHFHQATALTPEDLAAAHQQLRHHVPRWLGHLWVVSLAGVVPHQDPDASANRSNICLEPRREK